MNKEEIEITNYLIKTVRENSMAIPNKLFDIATSITCEGFAFAAELLYRSFKNVKKNPDGGWFFRVGVETFTKYHIKKLLKILKREQVVKSYSFDQLQGKNFFGIMNVEFLYSEMIEQEKRKNV